MKAKILVILIVAIILVLSVFAVKRYLDNSLVDKNGMVRQEESDTVIVGDSSENG